ncbi:hypothetical protein QYF61_015893 [Mycteria americana]|uniref:Uncharacterized protein n=1 Tax=Mycteria americana TaxID=33587 RepID=A0AAN7S154_MYCAM|nr:hypothetical protein QYF61_015893 [Mycteria americana]
MPEGSDSSWTSITPSEVGSSSSVSLSPSREDPHACITTSEASSSTEVFLSPLSDDSWTSITASHVSCSSRESLPTLVDGEDMDQASGIQPGLGHPLPDLEEQPGQATHPPCGEEVAGYLQAGSMQQHQQDLEIQLGAPAPPTEAPDIPSSETETPVTHHKGQDPLQGLIPAAKLEWELGLLADVDETPQDAPASAPPSPRRPEERDVMVVPIVQDLPFLAEAVKRQLECHIVKMKVQRRYGLPTKVLEYEKSFEDLVLGQKASQPPRPQRRTGLPFQQWDRRVRTRKSPGQPPGPQEESADPLDACRRGTRAPVHSGPAAFLGAAQEMPQEDEETPPYKRERGETASSSSTSMDTLPGTDGKEQGPGTQGDVHSPSPSDQEERALPGSEGAPQEQSGQGSESPSTSYGDMGPPELLLEQSVPVGEADHSLEGRSSSSEDLGTPELPSALAAPPRSSSPQTQPPSREERPSALPPSSDSAGTALHISCLEELLTEVSLSPLSDVSWTSIAASHVSCSSQASLPTLVDGEDMDQASGIQPGLGHPRLDLEEQPGQATHPPCGEEVASYLEAGSVQQHQQDLEIQLGAPTPPTEVLDVHSRETEMPITHHKGQDPLQGLIPAVKLERELGLPADVDETPQDAPASAPPSPRRPEERDVMVVPIVQDLPFLAEAVKRQLECHIVKMKVQRRYGLPTKVLEYEKSFEDLVLGQKASQPPRPQRRTGLPFQQWDRRVRTRKSPGQPPGPQEESADPLDACPRGTRAPVHSGPAAFLGAAQEMPQEDEETIPYKRERGETASSSSTSMDTLPGTDGKEQGPGTQGDVHSPSPSDQEERALPGSEGAPREQSGQGSESPSTSYRDMGPPELLLEQSVPVGEADHSLEGRSSSSEDLGTPELPSALAAPPRSSSPQTQPPSCEERPSALPPSSDSAGTALHISCLEELLTEVSLSPLSDVSWTSITASHVSCSSRESLPTLVDGEDMDQASSIQPGLGHPRLDLEEQPGQATHPPCGEEVASYLEAGSMQQHQQDLEIQLGAPTPPTEVLDVHSRETEMPVTHHKGQDPLQGLIPAAKLERELGLPADVDETPQDAPASAPPSPRRPEERDVMVVPIVQHLPFLAEAVKRQLERHVVKLKIQRRYGLPTKVLEYEKSFEDLVLGQKASQPPPPQRRTALPYRSPFQQWDRRVRTRKSPGQPPGPQEESADPLDACPRGTRAPVHSGPAAFLGAAQEMPQEDEETPPYKRERGETASSSSTSMDTLPGTDGKEQGPGTQGDVHSPSPSDQEERALPESEGAPQEQSGQGSESPSTSYGDMGPPELLLEQSVPVGEADHSLEGRSSSSEDLGTPELPSALAAPPRSSSPQTQPPSHEERPSALPPSPDSAGTALHISCLEELLTALTDCSRARQANQDLQNQLLALWLEHATVNAGRTETELAAELPGALQSRGQRGAEKGKGSAQHRVGSRTLCPKCSKDPRHSLPGSEGSQTWAPSDAAAPCAGREGTVGERCPPEDRAKRQQGQRRAAAAQQSQRVHVCGSTIRIPVFRHGWLLPQCAPTTLVPP